MDVLKEIVHALWMQDFAALAAPGMIWVVYTVLFTTLLLENGLLPASFLPGDSLLLFTGALIAKGVMGFFPTLLLLTLAASLGCWLSYLQGQWLGHTSLVKGWLLQLPTQYHQRAYLLFDRYGLVALVIGRFLAFVRTLLPTMAGISGMDSLRFQLFNWLSAVIWVGSLMSLGYALSLIPVVKRHEDQVMTGLMLLPATLLILGLFGVIMVVWRKKRDVRAQ